MKTITKTTILKLLNNSFETFNYQMSSDTTFEFIEIQDTYKNLSNKVFDRFCIDLLDLEQDENQAMFSGLIQKTSKEEILVFSKISLFDKRIITTRSKQVQRDLFLEETLRRIIFTGLINFNNGSSNQSYRRRISSDARDEEPSNSTGQEVLQDNH